MELVAEFNAIAEARLPAIFILLAEDERLLATILLVIVETTIAVDFKLSFDGCDGGGGGRSFPIGPPNNPRCFDGFGDFGAAFDNINEVLREVVNGLILGGSFGGTGLLTVFEEGTGRLPGIGEGVIVSRLGLGGAVFRFLGTGIGEMAAGAAWPLLSTLIG